jgi:hypothetical protein
MYQSGGMSSRRGCTGGHCQEVLLRLDAWSLVGGSDVFSWLSQTLVTPTSRSVCLLSPLSHIRCLQTILAYFYLTHLLNAVS